jgi:WD40 repeat protein
VHRDLKPSNILIDASGQPLVTDFGLAKRLWAESDLTLSGQVLGTPSFMAPEQASSKDGRVGRWSDIYSLGAILYHAATGRPPFQAASTEATLREVLFNDPVAPKSLNPSLPLDLQTICLKCLEKEPSRRYGTARELADDLNRFLKDEPIRARPLSTPEKLWRWSRRKPVVASLAASVTLLLIAIAVGSTLSAYRISNSLQAERREIYFNGTARAYNFIQDNQFNRARAILNDENSASYRGWEWGHLQWLCHQDSMTLKDGGHWPLALAFSPDERFLALTTLNRKLKVWNATTGKLQFEVEAHRGEVSGLAFSSDGQRVLTCFRFDSEVKVWDVQTGAQVTSFRTELAYPFRLAASRDGRWLAISGRKTVELRNAQTYELVTNLTGHGDVVIALAFSPNSQTLASGGGNIFPDETSKDGSIVLWDLETGRAKRRLPGHADTVRGLAFSQHGRRLASIGLSRDSQRWGSMGIGGTLRLWDVETGELIHDFGTPIHEERRWTFDVGFEVAFCRGDKYLVSTHLDSQIRLWDAETGTEVRGLNGHTTYVHAMAMGHGGEKFATGAYDNTVKLWSLDNVFAPRELTGHDQPVWALSFSPDSHRLATGSWDGTARIWNPKTGALKLSIPVGFPVVSLDFSPDGRRLATVGRNFVALVWDATQGAQLLELKGHSNTVLSVAHSPSGTRIATGSKDRTIRLWDAESGRMLATLTGHKGWVHNVDFAPDARRLVSASGDDTVRLWDVESGRLVRTLPGHSRGALCARFSPDGRWIASGGTDQTIRIWDAESGQLQRELTGHRLQGVVKSLAWSPDNRRLATATSEVILYRPTNRDFAIRIWDVETGRELLALKGHTDIIYALAFSDDGRYLAGADADSVVRLFPSFP